MPFLSSLQLGVLSPCRRKCSVEEHVNCVTSGNRTRVEIQMEDVRGDFKDSITRQLNQYSVL